MHRLGHVQGGVPECLACMRAAGGRIEGAQLLNGHRKDMATFARVMGYVEQFDTLTPQATVEETLLFSARMRLPREMQQDDALLRQFVREVRVWERHEGMEAVLFAESCPD